VTMNILLTGAAGFVGYHVAEALLARGDVVTGIDNLNAYYDPQLKRDRLARLEGKPGFSFEKLDIADRPAMEKLFHANKFGRVVHLAAQAGVRYSIDHPHDYADANLTGFLNILEGCRHGGVNHLVYASSSSVYGANESLPFSVADSVDHPVSLYAATKKANELMAHAYAHLYRLPVTGLRFFTVYGPWGRPDMAYFSFTKNILDGKPIKVFNHGRHSRDFTYIDDIVEGVVRTIDKIAEPEPAWSGKRPDAATSSAPYRLYNIGNNHPETLADFIAAIEKAAGKKAVIEYLPQQPGDVEATAANIDALADAVGFRPSTPLSAGIEKFTAWYRDYYRV
jgi:UDP-glucuronate 4-epimerase